MAKVGLINYGSGNFMSVFNALTYLDINTIQIKKPDDFKNVTHIILPGVGTFAALMKQLKNLNLIEAMKHHVLKLQKPYLGICVGMQILATLGYEYQECNGLDYIQGEVIKIPAQDYKLRLPHIGWNDVIYKKSCPLFSDIKNKASFYFVHSYYFVPKNNSDIVANCMYGFELTACVGKDNIYGVQFHPEKSQRNGLQILQNFVKI